MTKSLLNNKALIVGVICVLTFLCFSYTLHNQFTNWDDNYYVTNNTYIRGLAPENLKLIFTKDFDKSSNYHPFCMLSLAVNYYFAQLNPTSYYLTNILIHTTNVALVFFLFLALCRRLKMDEMMGMVVAALGGLWFGIHPMHVESVSWIAERKDVLYGMFYLLGLNAYLRYSENRTMKWYWITYIVFIASCLSKPMAVVFPLSLVCIDFLLGRELGKKLIIEKILFFLTSLFFGILAFYWQKTSGAVADFGVLTLAERFMYAAYGFIMYVSKFFNPSYLSTFYPYPFRILNMDKPDEPGVLNTIFYAAPFIAIAIIAVPLYFTYKWNKTYFRVAVFGLGFLIANLIFVLQFISVGAALMADRYSYIAYIGLIFFVAYFIQELINKNPNLKAPLLIATVGFSAWLGVLCYQRTFVWHDSKALLSDAISKYPFKKDPEKNYDKKNTGIAMLSYKWMGNYYFEKAEFDSALAQYEILTMLRSADALIEKKIEHIKMLKTGATQLIGGAPQSMPLPKGDYKPHFDSSLYYSKIGDSIKAFRSYIMAFRFNPGVEKLYAENSFNLVQSGQFDQAINQYNVILKLNTGNPYYYFYRGVAKFSKNNTRDAVEDWETAMKVSTKEVQVQQSASYNLSVAYDTLGKDSLAFYYVQKAKSVGYAVNDAFFAKLKKKWEMHKK